MNSTIRFIGRILLVFAGGLFTMLWIGAHIAWASMSTVANLMANDSGKASIFQHLTLIFGMFGGQFVAGLAGIPGGLAFFWSSARKPLLILFAILFAAGILLQVFAFRSFFFEASS